MAIASLNLEVNEKARLSKILNKIKGGGGGVQVGEIVFLLCVETWKADDYYSCPIVLFSPSVNIIM